MTTRVLLATGNRGKLAELRDLFAGLPIELVGLQDVGASMDVDEDRATFVGNATKKALELARRTGLPTIADDSGLVVDALGGEPGVRSARYAGEDATDAANNTKLLAALAAEADRRARFVCVLVLACPEGRVRETVTGTCEGHVTDAPRGEGGFGYDPLFVPEGESRTMAELTPAEKGARSHRGAASRALRARLEEALRQGTRLCEGAPDR